MNDFEPLVTSIPRNVALEIAVSEKDKLKISGLSPEKAITAALNTPLPNSKTAKKKKAVRKAK